MKPWWQRLPAPVCKWYESSWDSGSEYMDLSSPEDDSGKYNPLAKVESLPVAAQAAISRKRSFKRGEKKCSQLSAKRGQVNSGRYTAAPRVSAHHRVQQFPGEYFGSVLRTYTALHAIKLRTPSPKNLRYQVIQ